MTHSVSLELHGADCQLCFWGKPASEEQPYFGSLHIELGDIWVKLAPFEKTPQLCDHASFDWGTASSEHQLAASWTQDLQQHATVYQQLTTKLGLNHPMAKLIQKELDKDVDEPPFKRLRTSAATASFWQETAKSFHRTLGEVVQRVEQITLEPEETLATLQAENSSLSLSVSSTAVPPALASGLVDGSLGCLASLQSGNGNFPLHLKLELAHHLGSFDP